MIAAARVARANRALLLFALLAGCAGESLVTVNQGNYITFEHPFTDRAAAEVRKKAEGMCADRKQAAVRSTNTCSLAKCFTSYLCMDKEEASTYGSGPAAPR